MSKKNYNDGTTLNTRAYTWDFVIYEITKEYLDKRLKELIENGFVKHYAYIQHDKDSNINENGGTDPKPFHTHLLITFDQNISVKNFKERILKYTEHNTFGQPLKDKRRAYRYLIHADDPDKYQYDSTLIVQNDNFFSKEEHTINRSFDADEISQMIDDFWCLSYREQAMKYGRDYIKNFNSYEYFFKLVLDQEAKIDKNGQKEAVGGGA